MKNVKPPLVFGSALLLVVLNVASAASAGEGDKDKGKEWRKLERLFWTCNGLRGAEYVRCRNEMLKSPHIREYVRNKEESLKKDPRGEPKVLMLCSYLKGWVEHRTLYERVLAFRPYAEGADKATSRTPLWTTYQMFVKERTAPMLLLESIDKSDELGFSHDAGTGSICLLSRLCLNMPPVRPRDELGREIEYPKDKTIPKELLLDANAQNTFIEAVNRLLISGVRVFEPRTRAGHRSREEVISIIERHGSPKSVPVLVQVLLSEANPTMCKPLQRALASCTKSKEGQDALKKVMTSLKAIVAEQEKDK